MIKAAQTLPNPIPCLQPHHFLFLQELDGRGRFAPAGSGVLFSVSNHYFILTAAHVLDLVGDKIIINNDGEILPVSPHSPLPRIAKTAMPHNGRENDHIDLGAVKIPDDVAIAFTANGKQFLKVSQVCLQTLKPSVTPLFFCGYPKSRSKIHHPQLRYDLVAWGSGAFSPDQITELQREPNIHIAILFDREHTYHIATQRTITAADPDGLSGGGAWVFSARSDDCLLAGIGIEYNASKRALIATNMAEVYKFLRREFIETAPYLPA
jgi:hypothetical protein